MDFFTLHRLIYEDNKNYNVLIVEDTPMIQKVIMAYFRKYNIDVNQIKILDNATDAILYIGEHYGDITHYSLDFDLAQGEKGEQVAEFLAQQGNDGSNVWVHSGNPDGAAIIKQYLPVAKIAESPKNAVEISTDINQTNF